MEPLLALVPLALAACAAGVAAWRPSRIGLLATWGATLAAGIAWQLAEIFPGLEPWAHLFSGLFPAMLLAWSWEISRGPAPRWLVPAGLLYAGARSVLVLAPVSHPATALALGVDAVLLLACAVLHLRHPAPRSFAQHLLPLAFAALAVLEIHDAVAGLRAQHHGVDWWAWLAVAGTLAILQVRTALEHAREGGRRAQEELRDNLLRFEAIAHGGYDPIIETDIEGRLVYASPSFGRALGWPAASVLGRPAVELIHPDDREPLARLARRIVDTGSFTHPPVRVRHQDGSWRWLEGSARLYARHDGEPRVVLVSRDVTERIQTETRLRETQKVESLGLLAGGVAHDFNNLLASVLGNASLAELEAPPGSVLHTLLGEIGLAAERASDLTRQLLAYAGHAELTRERLDLSRLVDEMLPLLKRGLRSGTGLDWKLDPELPAVEGDATQLRQVVLNLVVNAGEAVAAAGGRVGVRTGHTHADRARLDRAQLGGGLPEGTYVCLEVTDDGVGMDPGTLARIFDPFFSTKGDGRGLGLAALLGIVRQHRGALHVESRPGLGTTFSILLPTADANPESRGS